MPKHTKPPAIVHRGSREVMIGPSRQTAKQPNIHSARLDPGRKGAPHSRGSAAPLIASANKLNTSSAFALRCHHRQAKPMAFKEFNAQKMRLSSIANSVTASGPATNARRKNKVKFEAGTSTRARNVHASVQSAGAARQIGR